MNRNKTEVLFVGGPLDSHIRVLDERHAQFTHTEVVDQDSKEFHYIIHELQGESCTWRLATLRGAGRDIMLQELVDWYCGGVLQPKCNLPKGE